MPSEISLPLAFVLGLFSTMHCLGMCGNIMGALSLSLPPEIRRQPRQLASYVLAYNLGRILTYCLLGLLAGITGGLIGAGLEPDSWRRAARYLAAGAMILSGLYLTAWFDAPRRLDRLGQGLWRLVEPLGRRLLPIRSPGRALLAGLVWGLLPCGLVYYALLLGLSQGDALRGTLFMALFGLGTLPALLATGMVSGWLARMAGRSEIRRLAGILIIGLGLAILLLGEFGPYHEHHHQQTDHAQHGEHAIDR